MAYKQQAIETIEKLVRASGRLKENARMVDLHAGTNWHALPHANDALHGGIRMHTAFAFQWSRRERERERERKKVILIAVAFASLIASSLFCSSSSIG